MKTLRLTIKKKWFDMIVSGQKQFEYREIKPYWTKRLWGKKYDSVLFINGYRPDSLRVMLELKYVAIGTGDEKLGAPKCPVYIIAFGEMLAHQLIIERRNRMIKDVLLEEFDNKLVGG